MHDGSQIFRRPRGVRRPCADVPEAGPEGRAHQIIRQATSTDEMMTSALSLMRARERTALSVT